jgi:hypothetical protein
LGLTLKSRKELGVHRFAKWVLNVGEGSLLAIAEEEGVDPN